MKNIFKLASLSALTALMMFGCGKSNDNGSVAQVVGPYGYNNCQGCVGNTQSIGQATAQDQLGEVLQLQFFGMNGATYQGYASSSYSQVAAQGILTIQAQNSMSCAVPPGQYQVSSNQAPAVMNGVRIDNMNLIATGPNQVQLLLNIFFISPTQMQVRGYMMGQGGYRSCELVMY